MERMSRTTHTGLSTSISVPTELESVMDEVITSCPITGKTAPFTWRERTRTHRHGNWLSLALPVDGRHALKVTGVVMFQSEGWRFALVERSLVSEEVR